MKMDPQNRLYSRDQVKTATLVISLTFSEEFQLFYKEIGFPQKIISQKHNKQEIMQNTLLPHLVACAGAPLPNFLQIMMKFTKFHQSLVDY